MVNQNFNNLSRMNLNSKNHSDNKFSKSIKFVVEKYINDNIPEQIECKDLHEAVYEAYKLFLNGELHSIGIYDSEGNYNGTDALNYFTDNKNTAEQERKINELEKEIQLYKDFLKFCKSEKVFEEFKELKKK